MAGHIIFVDTYIENLQMSVSSPGRFGPCLSGAAEAGASRSPRAEEDVSVMSALRTSAETSHGVVSCRRTSHKSRLMK